MVKYYGDRGMLAFEATAPGGENNPPNPFVNRSDLVEWEKATGVRVFDKDMWYGFAGCSLFGNWDGTLSDVRKKAYDRFRHCRSDGSRSSATCRRTLSSRQRQPHDQTLSRQSPDFRQRQRPRRQPSIPDSHPSYDAAWKDARNHPVYREIGEWVVIVDGQMVGAYGSVDDEGNSLLFGLDMAFPNQKAAAAFLSLLPADFDPADFGFDSF